MSETDIKEWIKLAVHDMETADLLIKEKGHADIIIYHLHQAIEKFLKALTIKSNKQVAKVHFLDKLLAEIIDHYPKLNDIKEYVLEINLYLPKLRYPYGDEIKLEEAEGLYNKFGHVKEVLLSILK